MAAVKLVVPSLTKVGVDYEVRRHAENHRSCSCPRSDFLKLGEECKHVAIVRAAETAVERCRSAGHKAVDLQQAIGPDGPALCLQCLVRLIAFFGRTTKQRTVAAARQAKADVRQRAKARKERKREHADR